MYLTPILCTILSQVIGILAKGNGSFSHNLILSGWSEFFFKLMYTINYFIKREPYNPK